MTLIVWCSILGPASKRFRTSVVGWSGTSLWHRTAACDSDWSNPMTAWKSPTADCPLKTLRETLPCQLQRWSFDHPSWARDSRPKSNPGTINLRHLQQGSRNVLHVLKPQAIFLAAFRILSLPAIVFLSSQLPEILLRSFAILPLPLKGGRGKMAKLS